MQPAMVALLLGDLDSPGLKERTPVWVSRGGLREGSGARRAVSGSEGATNGWPSPLVNIIVNTPSWIPLRFVRSTICKRYTTLCIYNYVYERASTHNMKKS